MSRSSDPNRYFAFYNEDDAVRWGRCEMPHQRETTAHWLQITDVRETDVVVELGCGMGALRDLHPNYIGLDFSFRALQTMPSGSTRLQGDMQSLPFADASVDFLFSWAALEHVPRPELALEEIARVIRPGGHVLLAPAWNVRPWASRALPIRSYGELSLLDRLHKASIPLRNSLPWRAAASLPLRLLGELTLRLGRRAPFRYRRLNPNMSSYVYTDSDAFTSMDPHAAIVFYLSRGWRALSHVGLARRIRVRHDAIVLEKPLAR